MIRIVGDINYTDGFFDTGFGIGSMMKEQEDPFQHIRRDKSEFWFGNFECVVSDLSNKEGIYKNQFRISPVHLSHITHFDLYNVANNHVMQHGLEAYEEMCDYLQSKQSKIVGKDDIRTNIFNHEGKTYGVLAFSQREEKYSKSPKYWYNPELKEIKQEFEKIKDVDFKIAYVHWGNEFINKPYNDQVILAHYLIDCGFDLVIGLHPHVLQGYEVYKGKHIFYSLGNFVFNMPTEATRYSTIVNLDCIDNEFRLSFDYVLIGKDNFPKIINKREVPEKYTFDYLNNKIYPLVENEIYYEEVFKNIKVYRKKNIKTLISNVPRFKAKDIMAICKDFIKRRM